MAAGSDSQSKSSNMWVLQTMIPDQYRIPEVIGPSRPLEKNENNRSDAYVGLYTMVIALITIAGGKLPEAKLDRALKRMNAEQTTPVDTKDKTLGLMSKDGYIVKVRESTNGDETVDYIVGPRGKVEVGREGFADLIRLIYGNDTDEDPDELEKKIKRTLDIAGSRNGVVASGAGAAGNGPTGDARAPQAGGRKRGRPRREEEDE